MTRRSEKERNSSATDCTYDETTPSVSSISSNCTPIAKDFLGEMERRKLPNGRAVELDWRAARRPGSGDIFHDGMILSSELGTKGSDLRLALAVAVVLSIGVAGLLLAALSVVGHSSQVEKLPLTRPASGSP